VRDRTVCATRPMCELSQHGSVPSPFRSHEIGRPYCATAQHPIFIRAHEIFGFLLLTEPTKDSLLRRACRERAISGLVLSSRIIVSYYRLVLSSRIIVSYYRLVMCCATLCVMSRMSRVVCSTSCTMSCGLSLNRCIHCRPIVMLTLWLSSVDMLSTCWSTDDFRAAISRLTSLTFRVLLFG
jgi:hypothetical protein